MSRTPTDSLAGGKVYANTTLPATACQALNVRLDYRSGPLPPDEHYEPCGLAPFARVYAAEYDGQPERQPVLCWRHLMLLSLSKDTRELIVRPYWPPELLMLIERGSVGFPVIHLPEGGLTVPAVISDPRIIVTLDAMGRPAKVEWACGEDRTPFPLNVLNVETNFNNDRRAETKVTFRARVVTEVPE